MKWYLFAAALTLSGCAKTTVEPAGVQPQEASVQNKVCQVRDWQADATASCQPGQKIVFLPNSWGNDQLPILFVAVNCDMRYSVAMNNGGVVCIHARMPVEAPKQSANAEAGKPQAGDVPKK